MRFTSKLLALLCLLTPPAWASEVSEYQPQLEAVYVALIVSEAAGEPFDGRVAVALVLMGITALCVLGMCYGLLLFIVSYLPNDAFHWFTKQWWFWWPQK